MVVQVLGKNDMDLLYVSHFYDNTGYVIYNAESKFVRFSCNLYKLFDLDPAEDSLKCKIEEFLLSDSDLMKDDFQFKYKEYRDRRFLVIRVSLDNSFNSEYVFVFVSTEFFNINLERMQEIEELNVKGLYANTLAHEIKNSLTIIKGFFQLFRARYTGEGEYVDLMMEEVEKAINLTNGFMRINRFSGDDIRWADVVDILTNLTKKLTIILNGEHIIKTCFKDIKKAMIDPGVLQRVCLNLLQNAIEAMNKTGIIYIYTDELTNGMIRIRIADNGCGIPKDIKDKIFLPNFTTKARGTGYGLAITDALLRKYNCKIRVRSKVGRGSIFTVLLPPED